MTPLTYSLFFFSFQVYLNQCQEQTGSTTQSPATTAAPVLTTQPFNGSPEPDRTTQPPEPTRQPPHSTHQPPQPTPQPPQPTIQPPHSTQQPPQPTPQPSQSTQQPPQPTPRPPKPTEQPNFSTGSPLGYDDPIDPSGSPVTVIGQESTPSKTFSCFYDKQRPDLLTNDSFRKLNCKVTPLCDGSTFLVSSFQYYTV